MFSIPKLHTLLFLIVKNRKEIYGSLSDEDKLSFVECLEDVLNGELPQQGEVSALIYND